MSYGAGCGPAMKMGMLFVGFLCFVVLESNLDAQQDYGIDTLIVTGLIDIL